MHYPTFGEYTDALQLGLDRVLADPVLRKGTLHTLGAGPPLVRGGTFALTFEVATDAGRYALRCFHKELDSLENRYTAIEQHLGRIDSPAFVKLSFQRQGITTESGTFPIVRMDWAEGSSLSAFVAEHRADPGTLQQLRESLRHLAVHLRAIGVAHGDIQPSNIIVQRDGALCLIDYDGMFVPGLEDYGSAELGQRNFQHPGRRSWHYDDGLDAFSFAVIDFTLDALCRRPELWQSTRSGEDAFLLRATDYLDPASSPIFDLLAREPGLELRTHTLASICASPFEEIPTFENFLAGHEIPAATIRFTAAHGPRRRPTYLSSNPVVNGADFAQCCRHVGDRVEVVGRVVGVVEDETSTPGATCVRVEFGEADFDTVSLRIWPEALPDVVDALHHSWVGQWISAIGLVEPVSSEPADALRRKHVSISITEPSQLQQLPEGEAQYRLESQLEWSGRLDAEDVGVRTERAPDETEPESSEPEVAPGPIGVEAARASVEAEPPPGRTAMPDDLDPLEDAPGTEAPAIDDVPDPPRVPLAGRRDRPRHWWPWVAVLVLGALGAYLFASLQDERDHPRPAAETAQAVAPAATPVVVEDAPPVPTAVAPGALVFQETLKPAALGPLNTVAGSLSIQPAPADSCQQVVLGAGSAIGDLCEEIVELAHRAVYPDREVLTGFTRCSDAMDNCNLRRPFWLELRADAAPVLRRMPGLWAASGPTSITASDEAVEVDLGTWHGEQRRVSLTAAGNVVVERRRVPARPLGRQDCIEVARALENCADSRACGSFADSARRIPGPRWSLIERAYHESTGLDVAAFKTLCVRSCEFGFTPSRALVRRYACNGAPAEQWTATGAAAGLTR